MPPWSREKQPKRRISASLADETDAQDYHAGWAYRYQWLRAKVIRHLPPDSFDQFLCLMVAVLVIVVIKGVFEFLNESLVGQVTNRTMFDIRNAFFRRVVRQDVRQLQAAGSTDLTSRFAVDSEQIGGGLKVLYGRVIAEPLKAGACFIAACLICWQLTLLFVVVVPLALYVLTRVSKAMRKASKKALERISAMYKILREAFDGVRAVKGFTREAHERRRFRTANLEFFRKAMRLINLDAFANPAIEVMVVLSVAAALTAGVYLVLTKSMYIWGIPMCTQPLSFETLIQFYVFLAAIADPVRKLSSVYAKLQGAEAASARIFEVYDREPTVMGNPNGPRLTVVAKRIEFRHVCFSYNPAADDPTLDDICFTVYAGETVAVVGSNGCGKTTLLALLPRFFDPGSGAVLIDGVNLRTAHLRSLRKLTGVVTQDTQLFDDTVFANIAYGKPGATREEVIEAAKKARAHEFIEKKPAGYDALMGVSGSNFSGGERQKIALARAILRDPRILILDEFTSAADPHSEADIHAAIKEFVKGRTTFLITHKLHTVPEIADRVVMMEAGKVLDIGTHIELLARCDPYRRLFESGLRKQEPGTAERSALPPIIPAPEAKAAAPVPLRENPSPADHRSPPGPRPKTSTSTRRGMRRSLDLRRFPLAGTFQLGPRLARTSSLALFPLDPLFLLFFFQLGARDLVSSHEARAAQNAQRMLDTGEWGLPTLFDGQIDLQKPPGFYWLVASVGWLNEGHVSPWVARLPAALSALFTVLLVYAFLRREGYPAGAFVAATALATANHFVAIGRTSRIDVPLTCAVTVALVALYRGCLQCGPLAPRRAWATSDDPRNRSAQCSPHPAEHPLAERERAPHGIPPVRGRRGVRGVAERAGCAGTHRPGGRCVLAHRAVRLGRGRTPAIALLRGGSGHVGSRGGGATVVRVGESDHRRRVRARVLLVSQCRALHRRVGIAGVASVVVLRPAIHPRVHALDTRAELLLHLVVPLRELAHRPALSLRVRVACRDGRDSVGFALQAGGLPAPGVPRCRDRTRMRRARMAFRPNQPSLSDSREVRIWAVSHHRTGRVAGDVVRCGTGRSREAGEAAVRRGDPHARPGPTHGPAFPGGVAPARLPSEATASYPCRVGRVEGHAGDTRPACGRDAAGIRRRRRANHRAQARAGGDARGLHARQAAPPAGVRSHRGLYQRTPPQPPLPQKERGFHKPLPCPEGVRGVRSSRTWQSPLLPRATVLPSSSRLTTRPRHLTRCSRRGARC